MKCLNCGSDKTEKVGKIKIVLEFEQCIKCGKIIDNPEQKKLSMKIIEWLKNEM